MSIRVLLADDHAVVREGLHMLLEAEGDIIVVGHAADGREAVSKVQELHPDIVIMDIGMPELNGIEATRLVRETCADTRVVILSVYATAEHATRALEAGAQGYVLKESAGREVVEAVRAVHANRRYLAQAISDLLIEQCVQCQGTSEKSLLERLSARELEILQLTVEGKSSSEIARLFNLSSKSVETYRRRLKQKLGINDLPGLVKFAIQQGMISLE